MGNLLALLACPIGMGLMMLFMGKGMKTKQQQPQGLNAPSLVELKNEQTRLQRQIERLERRERPETDLVASAGS